MLLILRDSRPTKAMERGGIWTMTLEDGERRLNIRLKSALERK